MDEVQKKKEKNSKSFHINWVRVQIEVRCPGAPIIYFNDGWGGGGGGGGPKDFFGSMKDAGIFLGHENNRGIFLGIVFFISSTQK